jgi:hypothetical protein
MHREIPHTARRSRSLTIAFLALAMVAVFGMAAQQAWAHPASYNHGGATCTSCHPPTPPTNDKCTACHTGGYAVPSGSKTCWTCHTPGQNVQPLENDAACVTACHLADGTTNRHLAHTDGRSTVCTTCHPLPVSVTNPGSSPHHMASTAPVDTTVSLKVSPVAIKLRASVKASGVVTPMGLGSVVSMTAQSKVGSKWVKAKVATAKLANGSYTWTFKPTKKGTYRIQAAIKRTATIVASASPWKTFKVK